VAENRKKDLQRLFCPPSSTFSKSINFTYRVPLDSIKIDRSFIWDMDISAALSRPLPILPESWRSNRWLKGLKPKEQLRFLWDTGYGIGQGFLFSAPAVLQKLSNGCMSRRNSQPAERTGFKYPEKRAYFFS
jgi:EAL domain-containing protein (putative c-di-GMP-specific phosphodiesterase class I)